MRGDKEMRKIALQIGIALTAGVFSFIPSVSAAPVLNNSEGNLTTSGVNVAVDATDSQITNVTGSQRNNVVDWQDFSVAQGETVRFSGNNSTDIKNYLNLVTGENTSRIDGRLEGGNDVYIVNPNGVIFGNSASVDVGSLYVSSRPIADVDLSGVGDTDTTTDMSPLASAVSMSGNAAAIVNMGDVQATSVSVEGGNIILADVNRIKTADGSAVNTNITLQTIGTDTSISLGHSVTDVVDAGSNADTLMNTTGANYASDYSNANKVVSIRNESELENVTAAGLGRNYLLIDDITLPESETDNHTPIGGDTPFTGNFDGQFHTISNVNVSSGTYGGLFGHTSGGSVKNVGVQGGSITAVNAGGIVGKAESTTVKNVFNNGVAINRANSNSDAGGIIGYADSSTIMSAYNTGSVSSSEFRSGGIAGSAYSTVIKDVYNTGETRNGLVGRGGNGSITNAYASQSTLWSNMYNNTVTKNNYFGSATSTNATYTSATYYSGFDISNKGGENTVWRIYEGQTLPLLRSFLTANGKVTVNYNYIHGSESGSNGGADLTANDLTYNGSYVTVNGTPAYTGANNIDTTKIQHYDSGEKGVRNAKTKALFFTNQQGYDLVGNNVTMAKRQISLSGGSLGITKVYDKSADASTAVQNAFANAANISGIVADDDVGISTENITGTYVNDSDEADPSVGPHKVLLGGNITTTGTDADNYTLEATDLSTLANVTGTITQRPIYLNTNLENVNFSKTYDGSASVSATNSETGEAVSVNALISLESTTSDPGTQSPAHGKITGDVVDLDFGTDATTVPRYVDIDSTSGNVSANNAANAGEHSVMFSGITLTGADAGNYVLCYNGTTDPVTNSQVLLRSGIDVNTGAADSIPAVIRPRLLATDGFQVRTPTGQTDSAGNPIYTTAAANKTYDGTSSYTVPADSVLIANTAAANSDSGLLAEDSTNLWFSLNTTGGNSTNFVDSENQPTKMAAGANAAVGVAYAVAANTNNGYEYLKGNYTFDTATAASNNVGDWQTLNNAIPTVSGAGTISRRTILLDTSNVNGIDKPYDGNANVTVNTDIGGGYLDYADNSPYKLLKDDDTISESVANDDAVAWSVTAAYDNKNVVRGSDGVSVPDNGKNVIFTVALTGDDAVNYVLNGTNAETASVPLTGTGKITPVVLTPNFVDISKTYNGTSAINDGDSSTPSGSITLPTATAGDDVQLAYDANAAYYYNTDTGQQESNAGSWGVYYPNLSLTGDDKVNYNLSSTTGSGDGIINRRLILSNGFQVNNGGTVADGTKTYDGTSIYNVPSGATLVANTTASGNTGVIDEDRNNLWFTLSNTATANFISDINNPSQTTSKVANAVGIAYQVQANTADGYAYLLNNYKIGTTSSATDLSANDTYPVTGGGNITRRAINIDAANARNIIKEYDGGTALVNAGDTSVGGDYLNYVSGSTANDKLLVDAGTGATDDARWSVTAAYDTKDVVRDNDYNVVDNGKTVNFNISVTSDDAANYTLNGVNAEDTQTTPLTLTGTGTINPKSLTASFDPVSKIYTGTTRINDRNSSVTGNGSVTPLTGDAVTLNYNPDEAYYDTPDAGTNKTVYYPNLSLVGTGRGNYVLSSTTGSSTGNSITTATVTLNDFVFDFADVTRVYNGGTAVADSTQGITAEQFITDSYIDLGTGTFDFRNYIRNLNANYTNPNVSANTGTGNVTYSFNLADMTIPNISISGDYQNYFANNPVSRSEGTITPKTVYATINNPVVTKTYNGAYDVQATTPLVNYNGLVGNSADATTAVYLDKNQGTDKLVRYDVAISDGSNYIIQYNSADPNMANYTTAEGGPAVTAGTVISTVVTPNNVINPKDLRITFGDVTKQYDGTTDVLPAAQVALGATTLAGVENGDNISLTGWNAAYNSPDVVTANTVYYRNITLSGNDNGNYNFVDANGNTLTSSTVINGSGTITPYALSGTYAFTLGDVTKEYDRTNAIKYTGTVGGTTYYRDGSEAAIKNFITAPTVSVNGNSQQMAYALDMGNTGYNGTTVGTHPATFRVGISSSNYNFSNITVTDGTNTVTPTVINGVYYYDLVKNNATITPRKVHLALNNTPAITKTYDGTTAVEQIVTGNNNKVYMPDAADFLSGDNVDVDWNNISAVYDNENAGNRNVLYTVGLTGTDAGNYELYKAEDNTAITDANKLTETGVIEKRQLTIDFARDEHIYNNLADVANAGSKLRLGNLANRDAGFALDDTAKALINGTYTDKNVNRADDGTVLDKGLTYNGLQSALADYATRNAIANNYTIADDSVTYSVSDVKGVIMPLEITSPLKAVWQTGVNKRYDATTALPTGTDANSVLTLQTNTAYDGVLSLQGGDAGYQYSSAGYVSKNQGDRALTYIITGVNPNQGNYQLSDTVVTDALGEWVSTNTTKNVGGVSVTGNISPLTINIIEETDSKIYDGGLSVADAKNKIHFSEADQAVIDADTDDVDYVVNANYLDKHADNGKTINYTLTLTGNDNGNYVLGSGTATITGNTATGTTTGNIAKRKVYVNPLNVVGIEKEYNGNTDLPASYTSEYRFELAPADANTGIVAGDEDIALNFNEIQGAYEDKHARYQPVYFSNFLLTDTNTSDGGELRDYEMATNSITGSGTIYPRALVVGINAAPTKGYDALRAISDDYATTDNLSLRYVDGNPGVLGTDNVNLQINSADYTTAKADTGKEYTYNISIDNTDYRLDQGTGTPVITVSDDGQSAAITAYDGVITKRKVYVSLADTPAIEKTYDGDAFVKQDVSSKILVREGDLLTSLDGTQLDRSSSAINARYDNKDAGTGKTVTYDVALSGSAADNYEVHRLANLGTAADGTYSTLEGTGTINKAVLTLNPTAINKTYNGTAVIGDGTLATDDDLTKDKLLFTGVNGESFTLSDAAFAYVSGQYGTGTSANDFAADANVSWSASDVAYKDVLYIGLSDALAVMNSSESTNSISKNYTIDNAAYFNAAQAKGKIYPKALTIGINAAPTKEYDTSKALSADYATKNNLTLSGVLGSDVVNLQVNSANYSDANAATNKTYSYGVSIGNTNYKLTQGTNLPTITVSNDGQTGVITADDGTITKRKVYVSLADTPNIVKTYDGNTSVKQDVTDKIIVRSGDLLNDGTELNRDASVINARYDNKDAGNRTVTYNTKLKGDAAGNYEIHRLSNINDAAADVEYSTLTGKGVINKAALTLDPASISKTYNGTAVIGDGTNAGDEALTKDKLVFKGVNNESFTLTDEAFAKVSGQYGLGNGDANVSWNGNEVAYKDVQYTGLSDALAVMNADASTNAISKNYTIDNTATFNAAQAKGKIKPVTITQAATENWKPVIREYNGDTDLNEVYDYSGGVEGKQLGVNEILTLTVTDADGNPLTIDYDATGNYDDKNVGDSHVLNYHIDSVNKKVNDGKGEGNYVLDTSVLDALQDKNLDSVAEQVYSVITPRQLNAEVLNASGNRKIYDGTAVADTGNFVLDKADQEVLEKDNLLNNVVITAYYDDKNASIAPDGSAANSKTITYTLGLNNGNGNYQVATPSAEALGDIEQRRVYVEAVDVNNIDKIYDGTIAMPDGYTSDGKFALAKADGSTGIVAGDEDIMLDTGAISGQYDSVHVQRDANGLPTAQSIRFTNFTLQDANAGNDNRAGNYYVATDSLLGSGTITPRSLTVGIKEAPVKVYDGETALSSTYAANDNLVLEGLLPGDNANVLIDSAAYADANAGRNKEYSYKISMGNGDYELVQGTDKPALTVTDNGQSGTITAQDGTITPRTLTASVIQAMTKEFDGTTDGVAIENPEDYILLSNNYIGKDKESLGLTVVAVFDSANAGKSEDSDELENHTVTYTLNLSNSNYELADSIVTGEGTIYRKGLNIVAQPAAVYAGEQMPVFSGTVEGLLANDSSLRDLFSFAPLSTTTTNMPGSYAVYGWYNNRFSGNLGQNYSFSQDANNEQAFTVNYLGDNTGVPDIKITPNRSVYQQISRDMGSGFGDSGMAAIEYVNKDGQVIGRETVDSGEIHGGRNASIAVNGVDSDSTSLAKIGISGGDIVNMDGADAASQANIEVDGDGSIVNLKIMPIDGEQPADSSSASIQIVDEFGNVLEEENEDRVEKKKKEGKIAIESEDSQNEDEIELEVKGDGVNVA